MKKLIGIFLILIFAGLAVTPVMVAAQTCEGSICVDQNQPVPSPTNFQFLFGPAGKSTASSFILSIINILLAIAGTIAVLFLIIGGIRYVTAEGSEDRAESAKNTIQHSIIGIVIVILSFVIVRIISNALIGGGLFGV